VLNKTIGSVVNYAEGNRIRKTETATSQDQFYVLGADGSTEAVYDMSGNTLRFWNINGAGQSIGKGEKAALGETNKFYYLKDHLGSVRITVAQNGSIASYDDYDPWGLQLGGRCGNSGDANAKYKFGGKERDGETGTSHYGWREYDGWNGRLNRPDRFDFKYPSYSPYGYCAGNPVNFVDVAGDSIWTTKTTDKDGKTAVTVHYTATIVNVSGQNLSDKQLEQVKNDIGNQILQSYTGSSDDGNVSYSADVDINTCGELRQGDNAIVISDLSSGDRTIDGIKYRQAGEAPINGNYFQIDVRNILKGDHFGVGRTGGHEFGHNASLLHPDGKIDIHNLMQQSRFSKGTLITPAQLLQINNNYRK